MTDKNLCEVVVVLDRSGSMGSIASDMEGGFRRFVADQRKLDGRCVVSLYQFDDKYEVIFEERDIQQVETLGLQPRGSTALHDAVGRTINGVGDRLRRKPEDKRPGAVVFLIITDGQENASHEFTGAQVKALIERQEREWNWKFVYLSASVTAFADADVLGIPTKQVANYAHNAAGTRGVYAASSNLVGSLREHTANATMDMFSANLGGELDENGNVKPTT